MNNLSSDSISKQYTNIVDKTNIVSKTDAHGIITYINDKFVEISGYTEDELIGQPHNIVRDPDQPSELFRDLWETLKSKKRWNGVITNLKKDGGKYTVNASIFPILDDNGEVAEYIAIRHDITPMVELTNRVQDLHDYTIEQENFAKEKLESGIINDLSGKKSKVLYHPSDILSGDFYSIYKRDDGSTFVYLIDGQGHGVTPAMTVFAISSMMNQVIFSVESLNELLEQLSPNIKNFLGEIEQLSYTMVMISSDKRSISYASAGMYPFLIKAGDKIIRVKANNTPFMNFSDTPNINTLEIGNWESLLIYSDGLTEHEKKRIRKFSPKKLIKSPSLIKKAIKKIPKHKLDDDVTFIYLENS